MIRKTKFINKFAFDNEGTLDYLLDNRTEYSKLYKSEKYFFKYIQDSKSFLELGCGIGNLIPVLGQKTKIRDYTGLDISKYMINKARELNQQIDVGFLGRYLNIKKKFILYNGKKINLKKKIDTSFSFGTLIYCKNYKSLIKQMLSASKKVCIFDLRLTFNNTIINPSKSYQLIQGKKINYNIINFYEALEHTRSITKEKYEINVYGYYDYPATNVITMEKKILMAVFCINKEKKFKFKIKIEDEK